MADSRREATEQVTARTDVLCPHELEEIVRRLVEAMNPERIYLFGSQARGDAAYDSDYDLMVILPESNQPRHQRAQSAYGALWGIPGGRVPVDVLVWTRTEFERDLPVVASLPATVAREGKLIHVARG